MPAGPVDAVRLLINPTGNESDYLGARLGLMDAHPDPAQVGGFSTSVWVVNVIKDRAMELTPNNLALGRQIGDWDADSDPIPLDDSGTVAPVEVQAPAFPNGIEWSLSAGGTRLYWSGYDAGGLAELRYRQWGGAGWSTLERLSFTDPRHRHLTNGFYSTVMLDRVILYVRAIANWQTEPGEARWCVDDGTSPLAEHLIDYTVDRNFLPLSGPVRPINDVYAVFIGEKVNAGADLEFRWYELRTDLDPYDPLRTKLVHRSQGIDATWQLMGVGARRAPTLEGTVEANGRLAFVLYALLTGPARGGVGTESWVDSYLVYYDGSAGGSISVGRVADAGTAVTVAHAWRFYGQPNGWTFMLDQEDYADTASAEPYLVLTLSQVNDQQTDVTQVWVYSAIGDLTTPYTYPDPPNVETPRDARLVSATNVPQRRIDAEPMLVEGGVYLYYRVEQARNLLLPLPIGIATELAPPLNVYRRASTG